MKSKAYKRAEALALRTIKDWLRWSQCVSKTDANKSLKDVAEEILGYGYQAATVDIDEYNRGEQCSHVSTNKTNQT